MPVIPSDYKAPFYFFSKHIETIYPALFRNIKGILYERERISTPDNDFLDLDWVRANSSTLIIISHGLEGNTEANYVKGMVKAMNREHYDVLAWNYRGCGGQINKQLRFYHSGETSDLDYVIKYAISQKKYHQIILVGFSVGGNITLKYLGEQKENIHTDIKAAITFSVPCDLESSAWHLAKKRNFIYMRRFIKSLHEKIKAKAKLYPDKINDKGFEKIKNFYEFDGRYTAPIHGFANAIDYWNKNSSLHFLKDIKIKTLLVTAKNDPFLTNECFPIKQAESNPHLYLEIPKRGGHCGFYERNKDGLYWSEKRAVLFVKEILN